MISYLLSIGPAAEKTLPTILTALACGAASPIEHLNILHLSARPLDPASQESLSSLSGDLSSCHRLFSSPGEPALFPCDFSFSSCVPSLPVLQDFTKDEKTSLFLSALRGKGQPLSFLTDREAAEWAFSILLSSLPDSADDSLAPLCAWLENVRADLAQGDPVRLTLLADLSDPFAAGVALSLLYHLRRLFPDQPLFLTLLALAETSSPLPASFRDHLRSSLRSLEDRSLLRSSEEEKPLGADAMWLLSLPSSMVESPDSHQVTALCAARVLSAIHAGDQPPPMGFHSRETDGTLSLFSLRENAKPFAAFACAAVWLLSDLLPSLRNYLAHPARLRSIAPNSRSGLFRRLFSGADASSLSDNLSLLDRTLRSLLSRVLFFLRSVPSSLRFSADTVSLWQQGVEACGRYITVAAELDVSAAEAHESGLDAVRPVHRDSLADTEEEQLIRRLQDMRKQLESEEKSRAAVLETMGGFRSLQVRLDCLDQCRSALVDAREKLALSPEEDLDHLTLARRERRVRLLEAAVARCEKELDPASVQSALSALPKTAALSDPWQSAILPSEVCHALEDLLSRSGAESVSIPPLFPEEAMTDAKVWIKSLLALCRDQAPSRPLPFLLSRVLEICREAVSVCRFLSRSSMPSVPLLPDLIPLSPLLSVKSCLALLPEEENAPLRAREDLRGLLALLMLRPYRRRASGEAEVTVDSCVPSDSPVLRFWLSSRGAENVWILSLSRDQESRPFALVLPGRAVLPARRSPAHAALVPAFASWFDPESLAFRDPCDFLGESDLLLLRELLAGYISALPEDASPELRSFLADFLRDLSREPEPLPADSRLKTRLLSACAFRSLSAYADSVRRVSTFYERFLSVDPLGACLSGRGDYPASSCTDLKEEILYLWQEIPFARESSRLLLESPRAPEEDFALSRLQSECDLLSDASDDYRDAVVKNLQDLLDRYPDALPESRSLALSLLEQANQPISGRDPTLVWPWDPLSPSVRTILKESLGETLSLPALSPFADLLAVFPARGGEVLGDALFSAQCVIGHPDQSPEEESALSPDAVLPPLAPAFARALCEMPEGRTLLHPDFLRFDRFAEDSFRVTMTLDGVFPVHLIRDYTGEDVLHLYAHDIPTLALWPSVPFPQDAWHAFYVYAHLPEDYTLSVLTGGGWETLPETDPPRHAGSFGSFPLCFSLSRDGRSVGALPNLLPAPAAAEGDPVTVCLDFGSAGTSVVFSSAHSRKPMQGPVMVRTLLNNPAASRDLLRREFLPAVPVSALLPTVSRIFRNVPGASPVPFVDGIVLMSSDLEDLLSTPSDAIYASLKWEEEKGRSGFLCLHQVMLMAALQARSEGAPSLSWRFSLPDEMAKEGRENLMNLFLSLVESVHQESAYPLPPEGLPVAFASESSALGAYFRFCAAEDTRGGFMVLDLGACTADISLFLRGREQAARTCQIPLGIQYMLLPSLLRDPDLLSREFGAWPEETFLRDLSLLSRSLAAARTDPVALRRARVSLDYFLADHFPSLLSAMTQLASGGIPTRFGALLLFHFAYLMMLSGLVLLQLAVDPSRNDFLPEQMSLCLSGRGASFLEALPPPLKAALWRFLTMFRNKRVASLSLLFSAEKKMEIPVGLSLLEEVWHMLPPASSVPASIAVRPEELLPEFLLRFRREFPASADLLFPGFYTGDFYHPFSPAGESVLSASISQSFPPRDTPRPYDSLSAWPGNLLDLL